MSRQDSEVVRALARIEDLLAQILATLQRIDAQGERQVELLNSIDKSQWS